MRRRRFRLSERAADDLTEIYDYIANANPDAAQRVIDGINAKIISIATLGLTGSPGDDMGIGFASDRFPKLSDLLPRHALLSPYHPHPPRSPGHLL